MNLSDRTVVVVNKIDTLQAENPQTYVLKVKEFLIQFFQKENIKIPEERIIPVSCKDESNIFINDLPELANQSFSDVIMKITDKIELERNDNLIHQYLPTRFSVLCKNKILGTGVIAQGFMMTGELKEGDKVIILPSMKESEINSIESYGERTEGKGLSKIIALNLQGIKDHQIKNCLLYTSPSPRDLSTSRMPSSA